MYIIPRIRITHSSICNFSRRRSRRLHKSRLDGPRCLIAGRDKHRLTATSRARRNGTPCTIRQPLPLHRDQRCPSFFRGILNPRSEDVDLYICEHFGQVLVSVGQNANRIAGYGLLKCFIRDASPPSNHAMFRETARCFTNATSS
jgi:hypothetical protein